MIYIFGIIFFVGVVLAIIRAEPEEKKPRKPKKKNFFERLGETGDPVHFSKRKK